MKRWPCWSHNIRLIYIIATIYGTNRVFITLSYLLASLLLHKIDQFNGIIKICGLRIQFYNLNHPKRFHKNIKNLTTNCSLRIIPRVILKPTNNANWHIEAQNRLVCKSLRGNQSEFLHFHRVKCVLTRFVSHSNARNDVQFERKKELITSSWWLNLHKCVAVDFSRKAESGSRRMIVKNVMSKWQNANCNSSHRRKSWNVSREETACVSNQVERLPFAVSQSTWY